MHPTISSSPSTPPSSRGRPCRRWPSVAAAVVVALVTMLWVAPSAQAAEHVLALAPDIHTVLNNIRNWIMGILAGLATLFLTVGGVRYLVAGGDPGQVGKAKESFTSAAFGYGLAVLAPLVVGILKGFVGE